MVSIPRDTKIDIDATDEQVQRRLRLRRRCRNHPRSEPAAGHEISHYAEVNFGKLKELVDAVGGVDVEVTERRRSRRRRYHGSSRGPRVIIEEGELTCNQALVFARSRTC
ncbi:MAG: LCP family protein [Adlercreutzia sp.]